MTLRAYRRSWKNTIITLLIWATHLKVSEFFVKLTLMCWSGGLILTVNVFLMDCSFNRIPPFTPRFYLYIFFQHIPFNIFKLDNDVRMTSKTSFLSLIFILKCFLKFIGSLSNHDCNGEDNINWKMNLQFTSVTSSESRESLACSIQFRSIGVRTILSWIYKGTVRIQRQTWKIRRCKKFVVAVQILRKPRIWSLTFLFYRKKCTKIVTHPFV